MDQEVHVVRVGICERDLAVCPKRCGNSERERLRDRGQASHGRDEVRREQRVRTKLNEMDNILFSPRFNRSQRHAKLLRRCGL
eukprot:scaffold190544_cov31-Tisochrysis_lutea.AAC.2